MPFLTKKGNFEISQFVVHNDLSLLFRTIGVLKLLFWNYEVLKCVFFKLCKLIEVDIEKQLPTWSIDVSCSLETLNELVLKMIDVGSIPFYPLVSIREFILFGGTWDHSTDGKVYRKTLLYQFTFNKKNTIGGQGISIFSHT